jgi:hypothetical protein
MTRGGSGRGRRKADIDATKGALAREQIGPKDKDGGVRGYHFQKNAHPIRTTSHKLPPMPNLDSEARQEDHLTRARPVAPYS